MQIRAYIRHFIPLAVIFVMAMLSITAVSAQVKTDSIGDRVLPPQILRDSSRLFSPRDTGFQPSGLEIVSLDTNYTPVDTLLNDTIQSDSTSKSRGVLFTDIVDYKADDSIRLDVANKKMFLYKNATIKYQKTELVADYIELDMDQNLAFASGVADTAGNIIGKPKCIINLSGDSSKLNINLFFEFCCAGFDDITGKYHS